MHEEEENSGPQNYVYTLMKYKLHIAVATVLLLCVSVVTIAMLPSVYRSEGKVLVETQQIPQDLVRTTVTTAATERIEVIRQRVMTRNRLLEIAERYEFFEISSKSPREISETLEEIQNNIRVQVLEGSGGGRRDAKTAIAFSVAYDSESPFIAQAVANDLVTLFLSENIKVRTQRATETTAFLKLEAGKIKKELDATELQIAELKQKNKDALPEHLKLYVDIREEGVRRSTQIERDLRSAGERIEFLQSQLQMLRSQDGEGYVGRAEKIASLKQELQRLALVYKPRHPDIVDLEQQILQLESQPEVLTEEQRASDSENVSTRSLSIAELNLSQQLADVRASRDSLFREREAVEARIQDAEKRILRIPLVERELSALKRENESKISQYNLLIGRSLEASVAQSLEEESKSERFSIIEPPLEPLEPIEPNRLKLLLAAAFFSLALPLGIVLLLGFLNRNIIGEDALAKSSDLPVLAVIPRAKINSSKNVTYQANSA